VVWQGSAGDRRPYADLVVEQEDLLARNEIPGARLLSTQHEEVQENRCKYRRNRMAEFYSVRLRIVQRSLCRTSAGINGRPEV
jgi:hypothetical protein